MRRIALVISGFAGLTFVSAEIANAQVCVRDSYGRVICGEPIAPDGHYGYPRRYYDDDDGGYYRPPNPGDLGPRTNYYRDCYNYHGNRICCPKGWTVQNGVCKPYRGY